MYSYVGVRLDVSGTVMRQTQACDEEGPACLACSDMPIICAGSNSQGCLSWRASPAQQCRASRAAPTSSGRALTQRASLLRRRRSSTTCLLRCLMLVQRQPDEELSAKGCCEAVDRMGTATPCQAGIGYGRGKCALSAADGILERTCRSAHECTAPRGCILGLGCGPAGNRTSLYKIRDIG